MPKFTNDEARRTHNEKIAAICEWRRDVLADLLQETLPKAQKDYTTWAKAIIEALEYYEKHKKEIQKGDSMFGGHKDSFINVKTFYNWKADVRDKLAERGLHIANATDRGRIVGIYLTRHRAAIGEYFSWARKIVENTADRHNYRSDLANEKLQMQLPGMAVTLSLPAPRE